VGLGSGGDGDIFLLFCFGLVWFGLVFGDPKVRHGLTH
jgi:hypothetical protein